MKRFPPFFVIGSVGMVLTAVLHVALAFGLPDASVHGSFAALYPAFLAFMTIGTAQLFRKEKQVV